MSVFVLKASDRLWQWRVRGNDEKKERELCFNERVEGRRWELSLRLKEKDWVWSGWVFVWKRRPSWKGKAEHCERERPEYGLLCVFFFFYFFNIVQSWKIMEISEVSVLYIYLSLTCAMHGKAIDYKI